MGLLIDQLKEDVKRLQRMMATLVIMDIVANINEANLKYDSLEFTVVGSMDDRSIELDWGFSNVDPVDDPLRKIDEYIAGFNEEFLGFNEGDKISYTVEKGIRISK